MSLSFKTVAKVTEPAVGNLRVAVDENGQKQYKFIGDKALTLGEVVELLKQVGESAPEYVNVVTKRSGYKYKTTWNF